MTLRSMVAEALSNRQEANAARSSPRCFRFAHPFDCLTRLWAESCLCLLLGPRLGTSEVGLRPEKIGLDT